MHIEMGSRNRQRHNISWNTELLSKEMSMNSHKGITNMYYGLSKKRRRMNTVLSSAGRSLVRHKKGLAAQAGRRLSESFRIEDKLKLRHVSLDFNATNHSRNRINDQSENYWSKPISMAWICFVLCSLLFFVWICKDSASTDDNWLEMVGNRVCLLIGWIRPLLTSMLNKTKLDHVPLNGLKRRTIYMEAFEEAMNVSYPSCMLSQGNFDKQLEQNNKRDDHRVLSFSVDNEFDVKFIGCKENNRHIPSSWMNGHKHMGETWALMVSSDYVMSYYSLQLEMPEIAEICANQKDPSSVAIAIQLLRAYRNYDATVFEKFIRSLPMPNWFVNHGIGSYSTKYWDLVSKGTDLEGIKKRIDRLIKNLIFILKTKAAHKYLEYDKMEAPTAKQIQWAAYIVSIGRRPTYNLKSDNRISMDKKFDWALIPLAYMMRPTENRNRAVKIVRNEIGGYYCFYGWNTKETQIVYSYDPDLSDAKFAALIGGVPGGGPRRMGITIPAHLNLSKSEIPGREACLSGCFDKKHVFWIGLSWPLNSHLVSCCRRIIAIRLYPGITFPQYPILDKLPIKQEVQAWEHLIAILEFHASIIMSTSQEIQNSMGSASITKHPLIQLRKLEGLILSRHISTARQIKYFVETSDLIGNEIDMEKIIANFVAPGNRLYS